MDAPRESASEPAGGSCRRMAWLGFSLGGLALLAYFNSFRAGLVLDNAQIIAQDPRIQSATGENLRLIFTQNYWWPLAETDLYRPLTTLSYLFNYAVLGGGAQVTGYHVVNFLLHWANACLVMVLVRRLSGRLTLAWLAAALFAVLPVNTESVTNIVGRADLLATFFILLGGWCYLRAAAQGRAKVAWLFGLGASTCLGVLAKESAIMIVALVFLYDALWRWPVLPGTSWPSRFAQAIKQFVLQGWIFLAPGALLLSLVRHRLAYNTPVFRQVFTDNPISGAGAVQGFMTAMQVLGRYVGLLVFPQTLSSDYSYNQIPLYGQGGADWLSWASFFLVTGLLALAWCWRRTRVMLSWGIGFFFLMILPTTNLFLPIGSIMGERFLYLPSIGFCVIAAWMLLELGRLLAARTTGPWRRIALWALPALLLTAFAFRSYARNADWQNNLTLWKSAVAASPNSFKAHKGYASALWDAGKDEPALDAALVEAEHALAILDQTPLPMEWRDDNLFQDLGLYYRLKGEFLEQHNQPAAAHDFYLKSVAVLERAREIDQWANAASRATLIKRGHAPESIGDVGQYQIYLLEGLSYAKLNDWAKVAESGRYVERLVPGGAVGYLLTGEAYVRTGQVPQAAVEYMAALLLDPANPDVVRNLSECYPAMGINPPPIRTQGTNTTLDQTVPLVHQQVNEAAGKVVQNFVDARRLNEARAARQKFMQNFQVRPEAFPAIK